MGRSHDKDVEHADPPETEPPTAEPPGRVEVDSRGHNVWRWARGANDSTSVVLKRLDNHDLALEPTQRVPTVPADPASKGVSSKGASPKGAAAKGAKGAPAKGASTKAASPKGAPAKDAPAKGKKSPAGAEASTKDVFHPARQSEHGRDGGGGFDPYNSR